MSFSSQGESGDVLSEINITPLVDVMLVLLVAFIVTIPVLNNAIQVNLPKTAATPPQEQQKSITVSVDKDSRVFIDRRELEANTLESELRSLKAENENLSLHLQADELVPYGPVARAMAAIERAGVSRVSVLTTPE